MKSFEHLTITTPRRNIVLMIACCGITLALGLWFIRQPENADFGIANIIGIVLLALGIILGAIQLRKPVRLILTQEGFSLTGMMPISIPWHEVEQFFVYSEPADINGDGGVPPHASWRLKNGAASSASPTAIINRKGGLPLDGSLPRYIGIAPEPLAELMEEWRQHHTKAKECSVDT